MAGDDVAYESPHDARARFEPDLLAMSASAAAGGTIEVVVDVDEPVDTGGRLRRVRGVPTPTPPPFVAVEHLCLRVVAIGSRHT